MLKKILTLIITIIAVCTTNIVHARRRLDNSTTIYNTEIENAINTQYNWEDINDPIRIWAGWVLSGGIEWIVSSDEEIDGYETALQRILKTIQNIVNYTLWILGLVALIYLIVQWFTILTAAWDDSKVKKWLKWIKNAFIAIAWIWLSRIIITFIIRLINTLAT